MNRVVLCLCVVLVGIVTAPVLRAGPAQARGGAVAPRGAAPPVSAPAGQSGTKVVGSVRDIMLSMVMPASDAVFGAAADEPKTDAEWSTLRLNAVELAESANLLMLGSRVRDRADWMKMARAQLDAAETVVRLASMKRVDGLSDASDKVYETCSACHNKYWADRNKVN